MSHFEYLISRNCKSIDLGTSTNEKEMGRKYHTHTHTHTYTILHEHSHMQLTEPTCTN